MSNHLGKRLSALVDGELGDAERERVLGHLARCESCRKEAIALRAVKQRMRALGEATADDALNRRLIAVAALHGHSTRSRWVAFRGRRRQRRPPGALRGPYRARRRRRARLLAVISVTMLALGLPTAAFLAGGRQRPQGPRITPSVDVFIVQHAITTGEVPVQPVPSSVPTTPSAGPTLP